MLTRDKLEKHLTAFGFSPSKALEVAIDYERGDKHAQTWVGIAVFRKAVFEALDNSVANGFDPRDDDDEQVASELGCYDADLEGMDAKDLIPWVQEWKADRGG